MEGPDAAWGGRSRAAGLLTSEGRAGEGFLAGLPFFFRVPRGMAAAPPAPPFSMKLSSSSTERSSFLRFSSGDSVGALPSAISFRSSSRLFCSSCAPHPYRAQHKQMDREFCHWSGAL